MPLYWVFFWVDIEAAYCTIAPTLVLKSLRHDNTMLSFLELERVYQPLCKVADTLSVVIKRQSETTVNNTMPIYQAANCVCLC